MRRTLPFLLFALLASMAAAVPKVAVLNPTLDKDIDPKVGQIVVDKVLEEMLKSRNFNILDRASRDVIWQERNFQLTSGEIDTAQIKEIGKGLGADYIVTVKMIHLGSIYVMTAQLIDVQSLEVLNAASSQAPDKLENAVVLSSDCGAQLAGTKNAKAPKPAAAKSPAPAKSASRFVLFDPALGNNKVPAGEWWYPASDKDQGGNSEATIDNGKLASGVLRFDYRIGSRKEFPYAILAGGLGKPQDLGKYSTIELTYRGKGSFRLEIPIDDVKDYNWHGMPFKAATDKWTTVKLRLKDAAQADWSPTKVPLSLARVLALQFAVAVETKSESGWLEVMAMSLVE